MLRIAVLLTALAALVGAPAGLAQRTVLMPGVTYEKDVEFTQHGPVALHVLRAPKPAPNGLHALKPVLSNAVILGREKVTQMQRRLTLQGTVAGVNGDFFAWADGRPSGMLMIDGALAAMPHPERSSIGITPDGTLQVDRVGFAGTWRGMGQRRSMFLNREPGAGGVALFTPTWGGATPARTDTVEVVLGSLPAALGGRDLVGQAVQVKQGGNTPIPPGGAVLVGRGAGAGRLAAEAPVGAQVTVRFTLTPDWSSLAHAIGGGPVIVRGGRAVFRANEVFTVDQLVPRHPRTAVGQTADGQIVLVAVDGRQPGYSVGMTNFELALTMTRLGAMTASALDGGGSTTMAFEGRLLNRPSDPGGERAVSEGLFVFYSGVFAPALPEETVSPNGDGVGDRQTLAYKVVRPSTVNARLVGPDGVERPLDAGERAPGVYRFPWTGAGLPEGNWRLVVDAVDDAGRQTRDARSFALDSTLGFLRVAPSTLRLSRRGSTLRASFTLARPARVTTAVVTVAGVILRTIPGRSLPAGPQTITWNGRDGRGRLVHTGRYRVRLIAQSDVGVSTATADFGVRRIRG